MSDQIIAQETKVYTQEEREQIARETFWGNHTILDHYIRWQWSYVENEERFPANSLDLADYRQVVSTMAAGKLALLTDPDLRQHMTEWCQTWGITRSFCCYDLFGTFYTPYPKELLG